MKSLVQVIDMPDLVGIQIDGHVDELETFRDALLLLDLILSVIQNQTTQIVQEV